MTLKIPAVLQYDDRLEDGDKMLVDGLNASLSRLNEMRALEINVSGPFARSKIAWKLAGYQHSLLHRVVALMDGIAVAWNHRCALSAMLSGRSLMETIALMSALERGVAALLARQDLAGLDALAQQGTFASRDSEWLSEFPDTKAVNAVTYVDKFDQIAEGFRGHYDRLSERCHPNSLGHNFMFAKLDREEGAIRYSDETEPKRNAQMIVAALAPLPLVESMMERLNEAIPKVAELQDRISPVGARSTE